MLNLQRIAIMAYTMKHIIYSIIGKILEHIAPKHDRLF